MLIRKNWKTHTQKNKNKIFFALSRLGVENSVRHLSMSFLNFIFYLVQDNSVRMANTEQNIGKVRSLLLLSWWKTRRQLWLFANVCKTIVNVCETIVNVCKRSFCNLTQNRGSCISFNTFQTCRMSNIWFWRWCFHWTKWQSTDLSLAISSLGQKVTHVDEIWGEITQGSCVTDNLDPVSSVDTWLFLPQH